MNKRVIRFASVGVINTLVDFIVLNILVFGFGMYRIWANVISTMTAMSLSYLLNHQFVFREERARSKRQYVLFIAVTLFGLLIIQNIIIYLLTHQLSGVSGWVYDALVEPIVGDRISKDFVVLNFAKASATVVTMIWNYELYKRLVFAKNSTNTETPLSP